MAHKVQLSLPLKVVLVVVAILVIGFVAHRLLRSSSSSKQSSSQSPLSEDVPTLVNRVARHLAVKQDEVPAVAIVQDIQLLKSQNPVFYKDAENGDHLLIWSDKAVLYSSKRDIILAVVVVNTAPSVATSTTSASARETATIEVRNGSDVVGLGRAAVAKLQAVGLTVSPPTDARGTYPGTLIIKGHEKPLPNTLQTLLSVTGGRVASLPEGEKMIKEDFLVIVGEDFKK